jgi:hypothetical protein
MNMFETSEFYVALKRIRLLHVAFGIVLLAMCLEAVGRLAPYIVGIYVHQPFLYSMRICDIDSANKGKPIVWKANERGARGELYHGEKVQIAVTGSSTSIDTLITQEQTWAEQVRRALGPSAVHLDNFARDGSTSSEAEVIVDRLIADRAHYNALLMMIYLVDETRPDFEAFHYSKDWISSSGPIRFPGILIERMKRQIETEPLLFDIAQKAKKAMSPASKSNVPDPLSRSNRALRLSGRLKFVDEQRAIPPEKQSKLRAICRRAVDKAGRIADHVFVILQPVAYDENEHPDVSKQWFSLYPSKTVPGAFLSNRTVAEGIRNRNALVKSVVETTGAHLIDLDSYLRAELPHRGDLFDDKWHFAPKGAALAGAHIAKIVKQYLPPLDTDNK